jgi:hypothetical protein
VPGTPPDPAIKDYIPARETIAAAQQVQLLCASGTAVYG